jgi:hypothetical protein
MQNWEEMFNAAYDVALADQDLTRPLTWGETLRGIAQKSAEPAAVQFTIISVCAVSLVLIRVRRLRKPALGEPG